MGSKMVVPSSRRRSARHDAKAYNRQNQMTKLSRNIEYFVYPWLNLHRKIAPIDTYYLYEWCISLILLTILNSVVMHLLSGTSVCVDSRLDFVYIAPQEVALSKRGVVLVRTLSANLE